MRPLRRRPPRQVEPSSTKPPKGSGLGTTAALENPKCNADAVDGYGAFPMITENGGPFCVAPAPKDNGGSTYRGVTATTIKVTVVLQTAAQLAADKAAGVPAPKNQRDRGRRNRPGCHPRLVGRVPERLRDLGT